jgi:hypothetical protein
MYRSTGASFAKAQAEFTTGVMRNEQASNAVPLPDTFLRSIFTILRFGQIFILDSSYAFRQNVVKTAHIFSDDYEPNSCI